MIFKFGENGMERKIYISNNIIALSEYIESEDDINNYSCWVEQETKKGYNHKVTETFEEFCNDAIKSRFIATIIRCKDNTPVGSIFLSPENTLPDLAIMIFRQYRKHGYGTMAFSLGTKYCFESLKLDRIYAGCYEDNLASRKMLEKCGFEPHTEGNIKEKHYLTGEEITQFDYIKRNPIV
jgi:ribosomal-protein-alanine N-acetyltransferase